MVNKSGILTLLLLLIIGSAGGWYYWDQQQPKTLEELLEASKVEYRNGEYKQAFAYALQAKKIDPADNRPLLMASFAASQDEKPEDAIAVLEDANKDSEFYLDCVVRRGIVQVTQGYAQAGRVSLEEALELDPMSFEANGNLFRLLRVEGRNWEARPYIERLALMGQYSANSSLVNAMINGTFIFEDEDKEFVELIGATEPDYKLMLIGQAKLMLGQGELDRGLRMLDDVLKHHPNQIEAIALKGASLLNGKRMDDYAKWREALPLECLKHPTVWMTLGLKAQQDKQYEIAARCFWEALRLYPHHAQSNQALAIVLRQLERKKDATPFAKRGRLLMEFEEFLAEAQPRKEPGAIEIVVERLSEMGRIPEAVGWCIVGANTGEKEFNNIAEALTKNWGKQKGWLADKDNPAKLIDLSDYPLPDGITINYTIVDHTAEDSGESAADETTDTPAVEDANTDESADADKATPAVAPAP